MTQKGKERVQKILQLFESCNNKTTNQSTLNDTSIIDEDDDEPIASVPEDDGDDDDDNENVNGNDADSMMID